MRITFQNRERGGAILIVSIVLLLIAALGSLIMANTTLEHERLNDRRRELWRAFYLAEAGIAQVQHWGNFPEDFTIDPDLFLRPEVELDEEDGEDSDEDDALITVETDPEELFPALAAELDEGGIKLTEEMLLGQLGVGQFYTGYDHNVGIIKELELLPLSGSEPEGSFFNIRSVGRSFDGLERTISAIVSVNPMLAIRIPAGLLSYNTAATFGNAKIHWGEAWSKATFDMMNKSQMGYISSDDSDYDPKAIYRTEATIDFPGNWGVDTSAPYNPDRLYDKLADQPGLFPDETGNYAEAFQQNIPDGVLNWPDLETQYQTFKEQALAHGRYYSTDAAGKIYRNGVEDDANEVDFLDEFGVADRDSAPFDLVFIDTVDGNYPADDLSNLSTIYASGTSLGIKGVFWIGAHFNAEGIGQPPGLTAVDPDEVSVVLQKIFLDGVLYAAGTVSLAGNAGVYGSVIAEAGFSGGGTPDIYYDSRLADGLVLSNGNLGSIFKVTFQSNYGE